MLMSLYKDIVLQVTITWDFFEWHMYNIVWLHFMNKPINQWNTKDYKELRWILCHKLPLAD